MNKDVPDKTTSPVLHLLGEKLLRRSWAGAIKTGAIKCVVLLAVVCK